MAKSDYEDTWWCEPYADDDRVLAARRDVLELRSKQLFEEIAARDPKVVSAIICVSQYWDDNAHDEVHVDAFIAHEDPCEWPHDCEDEEWGHEREDAVERERRRSFCHLCAGVVPYVNWGYGELVPVFEAYCHERGNQNNSDARNGRPFAVVTREAHGTVRVDGVGTLVRPWLDMPRALPEPAPLDDLARRLLDAIAEAPDDDGPRHVLADHWLERGDPRGEHLALTLHAKEQPERAYQLWAAHHRAWMRSLAPFVPRGGVGFSRGLLTDVELYIDEESVAAFDPDEADLAAVRSIRFLPGSRVRITPAMRRVRALGPLDDDGLLDLLTQSVDFAVETLEITFESTDTLEALAARDGLRRLRGLRIVGPHASFDMLSLYLFELKRMDLAWIEVALEAPEGNAAETFAQEVEGWSRIEPGLVVRVSQYDADARRAAGFRVELSADRTEAIVERTAPTSLTTRAAVEAAVAALPRTTRVVRR